MARLLVVERRADLPPALYGAALNGHTVREAGTIAEAKTALRRCRVRAVLSHRQAASGEGLQLVAELAKRRPRRRSW